MHWGSKLLQRLQEVRSNCKTRNQLSINHALTSLSFRSFEKSPSCFAFTALVRVHNRIIHENNHRAVASSDFP